MATRIMKRKPLPHAVVCDTNILWQEDKGAVANPDFDLFWNAAIKDFDLSLNIPDTVWGELQFQHFTSCVKQLRLIEDGHKKISSIAAVAHSTRITVPKLKVQIGAKFSKWAKSLRATIVPLPATRIDWARLAADAVWRIEPFVPDAKNPDAEKGFRDALILETVVDLARTHPKEANLAFISKDHVLRQATVHRLKDDKRFLAFESLKDFEAYLRLTKENLTAEFISKIRFRATEKFFNRDGDTCLFFRDKLVERLQNEFQPYFDDVSKSEGSDPFSIDIFGEPSTGAKWSAANVGKFWIDPTEFLRIENSNRYFWLNRMQFVRHFTRSGAGLTLVTGSTDTQRLLKLTFEIKWSAMVKDDARFHDLSIESIAMKTNTFAAPTAEEFKKFNVVTPPPEPKQVVGL